MQGFIFDFKRFAVNDGPGIRLTIFFKSCPLHCVWCHNPESIGRETIDITYTQKLDGKEFLMKKTVGSYYTVEEVIDMIRRERVFFEGTGGGVTFSGGEPLQQPGFLLEMLKVCRNENIHTIVDTSAFASETVFTEVMQKTDAALVDIKHLDNNKHKAYTGVSNIKILNNLEWLISANIQVTIRFPVIPGMNDNEEHLVHLKKYLEMRKHRFKELHLLPYHKIARSKYDRFGFPYLMDNVREPSVERMEQLKEMFEALGINVKIGG